MPNMKWMLDHPLISLCYIFLYLAVIGLWFPKKWRLWAIFLTLSVITGLFSGILQLLALIPIILLIIFLRALASQTLELRWRVIAGIFVLILAAAMELSIWPGYHSLTVLDHVFISSDAVPFTLKLEFSKITSGILLLAFTHSLIHHAKEWGTMFRLWWPRTILVIVVVGACSFAFKYVHFDAKFPSSFVIFAIANLLGTAMAEEALFRGFIQKYLMQYFHQIKYGNWLAIICAAFIFGCAHLWGGYKYMLLATIAGIGYGWIYMRTQRIEASMLTHFSLNITHFLLFTYPALKSAFPGFNF
jgi:membrane protease YdiL (CAAX protease family)